MVVRYPVLYLPSEIHNRDWDARLLIADHAAALGFTSVVGQQWVINENWMHLPPGLVLVKTINEIQLNAAEAFRSRGNYIVTMDEEAFAVAPDQGFLGILSPRLPHLTDAFFANSALHAEVLLGLVPGLKGKVIPTGNARTDLLVSPGRGRFAAEAEGIKDQLGPFILFNSNMAQSNSIWTNKEEYVQIQLHAGGVDPGDPKSVERFHQQFEFERNNTEAFMNALQWCLKHVATHRIVVRPHPVERPEYWQEIAGKFPQLYVAAATHHIPWMMAADAIVHTNSTTGLEAALLERPTVNLVPNAGGHWENIYVGTRVNPTFIDWREGMKALAVFLETGAGRLSEVDRERSELKRYFPEAFDGSRAKRIVENMAGAMRLSPLFTGPLDLPAMIGGRLNQIERMEALKRKFTKDFAQAAADIKAIRKVTKLMHPFRIRKIAEGCFAVSPNQR